MTSAQYKAVCARPDVMIRLVVKETARLLSSQPAIQTKLQKILAGEPISKPALHTQEPNSDRFLVDLSKAEADEIVSNLLSIEAEVVTLYQTPFFVASYVDAWTRYADFKEQQ